MNAETIIQEAIDTKRLDFRPAASLIAEWHREHRVSNAAAHWIVYSPSQFAAWYRNHFLPQQQPKPEFIACKLPSRTSQLMETPLGGVWVFPASYQVASIGYPNDHPEETIGLLDLPDGPVKLTATFTRSDTGQWHSGMHRFYAWRGGPCFTEHVPASDKDLILAAITPTLEQFWQDNALEFLSAGFIDANNRVARLQGRQKKDTISILKLTKKLTSLMHEFRRQWEEENRS